MKIHSVKFILKRARMMYDSFDKTSLLEEQIEEFAREIKYYADNDNYDCIVELGYQYYCGTLAFSIDYKKACKYLSKAFRISKDPYLANTLGYIYYYGRTTNGIPDYKKAIKYYTFAMKKAYIIESTYKLADCYYYGYGVEKDVEKAKQYISNLFEYCGPLFLKGNYKGKLADVALRYATYLYDANENIEVTYLTALLARIAIQKRIEVMDYVGDKTVAMEIEHLISKIIESGKIDVSRTITTGGLLIDEHSSLTNVFVASPSEINLTDIGVLVTYKYSKPTIFSDIHMDYAELKTQITFILKGEVDNIAFPEEFSKATINKEEKYLRFHLKDDKVFDYYYDEIIYFMGYKEKDMKNIYYIEALYPDSDKPYPFISDNPIYEGDNGYVYLHGERKTVKVTYCTAMFPDELPIPINKIKRIKDK